MNQSIVNQDRPPLQAGFLSFAQERIAQEADRLARELHQTDVQLGRVGRQSFTDLSEAVQQSYRAGGWVMLRLGRDAHVAQLVAETRVSHRLLECYRGFAQKEALAVVKMVWAGMLTELSKEGRG